jgi:hypothetical protein
VSQERTHRQMTSILWDEEKKDKKDTNSYPNQNKD